MEIEDVYELVLESTVVTLTLMSYDVLVKSPVMVYVLCVGSFT